MATHLKLNIICTDEDWIMGRIAKELLRGIPGATLNRQGADIDYCVPYTLCYKATAPIRAGMFTHLEPYHTKKMLRMVAALQLLPYRIALSKHTARAMQGTFGKAGEAHKIIHLGSDIRKPIVFGVCGNGNNPRKNIQFVRSMIDMKLNVAALGPGWPASYPSNYSFIDRHQFYKAIDYLVVTSTIEGGPVPVLDAIAAGIPVIAPDVGWCFEYPVIRYARGEWESLRRVLLKLSRPRTWADCARDHEKFFKNLPEI